LLGRRCSAFRIADDPAYRVAGGDWTGADELLAFLEGDVGHLAGRAIDLVERALGKRIDLDGIEVTAARRLNAGSRIREVDPLLGIAWLGSRSLGGQRLELAGQRQWLGNFDDLYGLGRLRLQHGGLRRIVVADRRQLEGAAAERGCGE